MIWMLVACNPWSNQVLPEGNAPPLPEEAAWEGVRPLDGAQRLFGGPFRCRIPDGTVVDFHPNGIARGEPAFRGRWQHEGEELRVEARHHGVEIVYAWSYRPYTHEGNWMLATQDGALACRPGHEAEPGAAGAWVEVIDAGGATLDVARVLSTSDVVFAVDGAVGEKRDGLLLRYASERQMRPLAQHLADGLGVPVELEVAATGAPFQLVVGSW